MKKIMEVKPNWLALVMACVISFGAISIMGCAGRTKTSTVTTQTTNETSGSGSANTVTIQKEVVTADAHPRGVIGGIFYTIGQVLIWPFKFIGSLFS